MQPKMAALLVFVAAAVSIADAAKPNIMLVVADGKLFDRCGAAWPRAVANLCCGLSFPG
jgi:hypothetical protein